MNKKAKIAITGGAGYIGSFTVKYLKALGHENVVILDNFATGHKEVCFSRYYEIDLLDSNKLNEIFEKERFDSIIHFASLIIVPHSMSRPYQYFNHNLNSSLNLLEAMKNTGVKQLVFSSTCALYGIPEKLPITEDELVKPESVYAESKWMIERIIHWYWKIFGIKYANLRYFNACGAAADGSNGESHDPETHLIPSAINNVLRKKPIVIYGNDYDTSDGTCVRDYIHVDDLADAHCKALEYLDRGGESGVFNLGAGRGYSNKEVVSMVESMARQLGHEATIEYKSRREGDVPVLYADSSKAQSILSWKPKHTDLQEVIKEAFFWHRSKF